MYKVMKKYSKRIAKLEAQLAALHILSNIEVECSGFIDTQIASLQLDLLRKKDKCQAKYEEKFRELLNETNR